MQGVGAHFSMGYKGDIFSVLEGGNNIFEWEIIWGDHILSLVSISYIQVLRNNSNKTEIQNKDNIMFR